MTLDEIFEKFSNLEIELREQGAEKEDIVQVLRDLAEEIESEDD